MGFFQMETESSAATAAEVSRNFGQWQDRAMAAPVVVTHHGRPRVVIISAQQYQKLALGREGASGDDAFSHAFRLSAILEHASEAFFALDAGLNLTGANGVFTDLVGRTEAEIIGLPWRACLPDVAHSVVEEQLARVVRTGESVSFEMASGGTGERLFAVRAFPYAGGVAALMANCTQERMSQVQVKEGAALRRALSTLPSAATAQLNVRGVITAADKAFSRISGFTPEELRHVRLTDLLFPRDRASVMRALETVYQEGGAECLNTVLLTRGGDEIPVEIAMAGAGAGALAESLHVIVFAAARTAAPSA
jgi:prevent-host-death family protein